MRPRLPFRLLLVALVVWVGWACTETLVSVIDVGGVQVQPDTATIFVEEQRQLQATITDGRGNALSGRELRWTSEHPAIASTSEQGMVQGLTPGIATIAATSEGVRGTARITVLALPTLHLDRDSAVIALVRGEVPVPADIAVTNAGGGTLSGLDASVEYQGDAADWLELELSGTDAPATLVLSPVSDGLTPGMYRATVTVSAANASNGPLTVGVRFELVRPAPAAIAIAGGDDQSAVVADEVSEPVSVLVTDANGAPVEDVAVTWTVTAGGGTLSSPEPVLTSTSGIAVAPAWRLGTAAGVNTLTASIAGLDGAAATFTATALAGTAAKLALATAPSSSTQSGAAFAQQPIIQLTDGFGNAVAQAGISVTAEIMSGGGTLGGTLNVATDAIGAATFTDLAITGAVGDRTLRFSAPFMLSIESAPISVTTGTAVELSIATQPSALAQAGTAFVRQPVIRLLDAGGNPVSDAGTVVTAAIASGGGTLEGTLTATADADGIAAFTNLGITGLAGTRTLTFTAAGLTAVTSEPVEITPGSATRLSITTQPPVTMSSGAVFSRQPVVQLRDVGGNAIAQAGVAVTVGIASGGGDLGGTHTVNTDAAGAATFTDLWIAGTAGDRTLEFAAAGLTSVVSDPIAITTGAGTRLTLATQPSASAQSGVPFERQPVIQLRDDGGNAVSQAGVLVTAAIAAGGGTLGGTVTATTTSSGIAAFTDLRITGLSGDRTLQFTASGIAGTVSEPITITPGPASQLTITTSPPSTAQSGVPFTAQPAIQLTDAAGNVVSQAGVTITVAIATGGGTLGGDITADTDGSGTATFTDLSIAGTVGDRTLVFTADGLASAASGAISITAGPASAAHSSATVPNGIAGAPTGIAITVRDASDNRVTGAAAQIAVTVTGANMAAPTVSEAGNGDYSATYTPVTTGTDHVAVTLDGTAINGSPYTTTVSAGGVSSTNSSVDASPAGPLVANGVDAFTVTVEVRDDIGNPIGGLADDVSVSLTDGATMNAVTETSTQGTYMFNVTSTLANTVAILVTVSGTLLAESPTIEFVPGAIASSGSGASASPATGVLADGLAPSTVTVTLGDAFGNAVTGLTDIDFVIDLGLTSAERSTVTASGTPGTYTFSVTNTVAENVTVTVTAGGVTLTQQPIIEFVAGTVDATLSTVSPDRTTDVTADGVDFSTVTVALVDANGNPIGGLVNADFVIGLTGGAAGQVTETATAGTYTFTVTNTTAQTVTLTVTASGTELDANPTITFVPGPVSATASSVVPSRLTGVTADGVDASTVTVTVTDANGNAIGGLGSGLVASVSGTGVSGTITEGVSGTYTFNVTNTTAETVTVTVTADGVVLDDKPTIEFVTGSVSATQSTAEAAPTTDVTADGVTASTVTVMLKDGTGNAIGGQAAGISAVPSGSAVAGVVTETATAGTYTFTVTNTVAESITVTITANSVVLDDAPAIAFVPGAVSASVSSAAANPATGVTADGVDASTVTVTVRDAQGNVITGLAGSFTIVDDGSATVGAVSETATPGTYSFQVTNTVAETVTLTITVSTVTLDDQPTIEFVAGAVSAANSNVTATSPVTTGN